MFRPEDSKRNRYGKESVEVECFAQVAVEERGESAGGSAAWALQMEEREDGALRIEAVLLRRETQQRSDGESETGDRRDRVGCRCDAGVSGRGHDQ